jgi:MFS family permease
VAVSGETSSQSDATIGELVAKMSEQTTRLVRDEIRLAQAEVTQKGKKLGVGAGLMGGAGIIAVFGLGTLIAAAVIGLALAVAAWAAALIVAVVLFVIAGIAALVGKRGIAKGTPPVPAEALRSSKQDIRAVKQGIHS